ncbi:hypothetical protein [Streptomyces sp. SS8]
MVPTDGAVSRARDRPGSAPLRALFVVAGEPTVPAGHDEVFWRDLRKAVVDGTTFDVPAGADGASAFGTPGRRAFPQIVADVIGFPPRSGEEVLQTVRRGVAGLFGRLFLRAAGASRSAKSWSSGPGLNNPRNRGGKRRPVASVDLINKSP